jgi:hypothetical protein
VDRLRPEDHADLARDLITGDDGQGGMAGVDLYWLPLGAGGHFVRLNGRLFETVSAWLQRRPAQDLYHSALQVRVGAETYVIEQAPVSNLSGNRRGVVAEGAVGSRFAARFRIFRYEIRLWRGGHIPDVAEAVDSPGASAMTSAAPDEYSRPSHGFRPRSGDATSLQPARCGTQTR